ncbi:exodeoxyribonuclease V subunit alpha [Acidithiobacillus sp. IBUN Pt1247-S3]|uniref:exodeoxyribonuclease V subunit alpha n=1 Tax=Acidithiobacillus sp. IBUN Pt1247-S3 TaxID=3166642 RepID=UPI0034E49CFA
MIPSLDCSNPRKDPLQHILCIAIERAWLRLWDAQLALFFSQQAAGAPAEALLAAALCSQEAAQGQVYLDLRGEAVCNDSVLSEWWPRFAAWETWPHLAPELFATGEGATPLVLQDGCIYLRRFWEDEQRIASGVRARLAPVPLPPADLVAKELGQLFPASDVQPDWQRIACALMLPRRFGVISGGPGTGKTTTVLRLLLLLQSLALRGALPQQTGSLRIRLAAPTGKAAARLSQSLVQTLNSDAFQRLPLTLIVSVPREVETVHRLLGLRSNGQPRYNSSQPLALDLLVIDEASMLSQELMAKLLNALPPTARLILLGDKDQLASVEAGAVLAELCANAESARYSEQTRGWIADTCACVLQEPAVTGDEREQAIALLRHSYRFSAQSGIGRLAEQIRLGQTENASALLDEQGADLRFFTPGEQQGLDGLLLHGWGEGQSEAPGYLRYLQQMQAGLRQGLEADQLAQQCLQTFSDFQLLCVRREGPWGVEAMNARVTHLLQRHGAVPVGKEWFAGRPVMITRNSYSLRLMNGEVGIALPITTADGRRELRVAFAGAAGEIRWFSPTRLQEMETVFALTVHKSQGSEYRHCAFLAAVEDREFWYRELLYTAVTRARSRLSLALVGGEEVLGEMINRPLRRTQRIFLTGEKHE